MRDSRIDMAGRGLNRRIIGMAIVVAGALAACTGTTTSSGSAAPIESAAATICESADALRTAVNDLKAADLVAVGTEGVKAAVAEVRAAGQQVRASAGDALASGVSAFEGSLEDLSAAVDQIGEGEIGSAVEPIRTAIDGVQTVTNDLVDQIEAASCP